MLPELQQLRRILSAGILAPSAENKHYLRFRIAHDSVSLASTDRASWAALPHRRFLALLSYGAVLENIALRSAHLGHGLVADLFPDPAEPDLIAQLRWTSPALPPDPLDPAIEGRHTNRRFYAHASLPGETLAQLSAAAAATPGARLLWLDDANSRGLALQTIRIAETERFLRPALHHELFGAVRFDNGWRHTTDEWLPLAALQIEPPMRLPFALLRHWPLMRASTWLGAHLALGLRAGYLPCALAPHIGLLVVDDPRDDTGVVRAGRGFQRLWLAAQAAGLALQPMAAATVLANQAPAPGWVRADVKLRLQKQLARLAGDPGARPCMLFRAGRAKPPTVVTGRLPLDHYLV